MIRLERPETDEFIELMDNGEPDQIVNAFSIYLSEENGDVPAFMADKHLVFLTKKDIEFCFKMFDLAQDGKTNWGTIMEETVWADEYAEAFAERAKYEMNCTYGLHLWIYSMIEEAFALYERKYSKPECKKVLGYKIGKYLDNHFEKYVSELFDSEKKAKEHMYDTLTNNGRVTFNVLMVTKD